jgi:hypothetical protein
MVYSYTIGRARGLNQMPNLAVVRDKDNRQMAQLSNAFDREAVDLRAGDVVETILGQLRHATPCFVAGMLLVRANGSKGHGGNEGQREGAWHPLGQVFLCCARPVDAIFLEAVQKHLLLSYRLSVGPALIPPQVQVIVYDRGRRGDLASGPCEPPRSVLAVPILCGGRAAGMLSIASVFRDAFGSRDLCTLADFAAQASAQLCSASWAQLEPASAPGAFKADDWRAPSQPQEPHTVDRTASERRGAPEAKLRYRVDKYLQAISGLAELWRTRKDQDLPEALRKDLETIILDVFQVQELLSR